MMEPQVRIIERLNSKVFRSLHCRVGRISDFGHDVLVNTVPSAGVQPSALYKSQTGITVGTPTIR